VAIASISTAIKTRFVVILLFIARSLFHATLRGKPQTETRWYRIVPKTRWQFVGVGKEFLHDRATSDRFAQWMWFNTHGTIQGACSLT
jgi:hypothetical protein